MAARKHKAKEPTPPPAKVRRPRGRNGNFKPGTRHTGRKQRADISKRLLPDERALVNLVFGKGYPVARAERALGMPETYGYKILNRDRVKKFVGKLGEKVEEKAIEKVAEQIADMLDLADKRIVEILSSPRDDFFGYKDILNAVKLAYQRKRVIGNDNPQTPGAAAAAALAATQVNVTVNQGGNVEGEAMYEPAWVRKANGINDPDAEALERSYGITTGGEAVADGAAVAPEAVETKDESADSGA